jgi:hypothetical protein
MELQITLAPPSPLSLTFQTMVQSTGLDVGRECRRMQGPSKHESYNTN